MTMSGAANTATPRRARQRHSARRHRACPWPWMGQDRGVMATRILFVEDDDAIRETTRLALEDEDYLVDEATTGEDALRSFERQPADCVLLDLMLPDLSGFEVCRSLRQRSTVPIIMVTARSDTFDVVAGLEAGADDYVTKPFQPKELAARIRALLRRARGMEQPSTGIRLGPDLEVL